MMYINYKVCVFGSEDEFFLCFGIVGKNLWIVNV